MEKQLDLTSQKEESLNLPKSNVLTFYLENGAKVIIRPISLSKSDLDNLDRVKLDVQKDLDNFVDNVKALL